MKLKTLKDFCFNQNCGCENYFNLDNLIQEAIKWVKSFEDYAGKESAQAFIFNFFNITEEDLK